MSLQMLVQTAIWAQSSKIKSALTAFLNPALKSNLASALVITTDPSLLEAISLKCRPKQTMVISKLQMRQKRKRSLAFIPGSFLLSSYQLELPTSGSDPYSLTAMATLVLERRLETPFMKSRLPIPSCQSGLDCLLALPTPFPSRFVVSILAKLPTTWIESGYSASWWLLLASKWA